MTFCLTQEIAECSDHKQRAFTMHSLRMHLLIHYTGLKDNTFHYVIMSKMFTAVSTFVFLKNVLFQFTVKYTKGVLENVFYCLTIVH